MAKELKGLFKHIRISPLKLRRIANLVRSKNCVEALSILNSLPHKGARIVEKIIRSVMANARNNHKLDDQVLVVSKIFVDGAGMLKRHRAQSRGRAAPIKKRMSHLTVLLGEK